MNDLPTLPPLKSEDIEPTMVKIMCHLYAECEQAKDEFELTNACEHLWYGIEAINKLAVAVSMLRERGGSSCLHFSIAANNEVLKAAEYIEFKTGVNPLDRKST